MEGDETLVQVYAGNRLTAEYIQSLLEAYGIQAFIQDEIRGNAPVPALGYIGGVKVLVAPKNVEEAKSIIRAAPESSPSFGS
ncbi:MAG: DUF2007 domain-containing protein [Bacteroidota bacterium]